MTVFGALGVSWDKLQWLAAALSVGLGFWSAGDLW